MATVLVLGLSGSASADYLKHYFDGREAYRNRKYRESVVFLDRAIKLQPQSGERVRWTGTHFESYLPYFHLGRALFELGQYDQALRVWAESERQGKIRDRANRRLYAELRQRLERLQTEGLPEELERLRRDVEDTVEQLTVMQTRGIGGLATDGGELDQVATLLATARRDVSLAGGERTFEPLGSAGKALGEARLRLLRALDAEERRQRLLQRDAEDRRIAAARQTVSEAQALLSGGGCQPQARTLLLRVLTSGTLPAELRRGPESLPVLLSRAHEQCGDLLGAEQFLELVTDTGADPRGEQRRIAAARLHATLAQIDTALAAARCEVASIAVLEDLAGRAEIGLRLARAYADCELGDLAGEALRGAVDRGQAADEPARVLRERIARLRPAGAPVAGGPALAELLQVRRERAEERALSSYLLARARVEGDGCDRAAVAALRDAIPGLPASPGAVEVQPDLDLARAYRSCGDREQTRRHLDRARVAKQGTPDDIAELEGWLKRTQVLDIYAESHALLVGVADYQAGGWGPLPEVLEDLAAVEAELRDHGFAVQKLIDPTHDELVRTLNDFFARKRRPDSRLVFYYGGHGHTEINDYLRLGYIVPADTPFPGDDPDARYLDYLVSMDGFEGFARATAANHAMFLFDSCFSGTIFDAAGSRFRMNRAAAPDPAVTLTRPVRLFVTAGDETEMVPAESVFRAAVVRALEGFADADADGLVLGDEVGGFVATHGATSRNTPRWGVLQARGFDSGDMAFRIPDFEARALASGAQDAAAAAERALWRIASDSPRSDDLRQYLERYPAGQFVDAAEWMIRRRTR